MAAAFLVLIIISVNELMDRASYREERGERASAVRQEARVTPRAELDSGEAVGTPVGESAASVVRPKPPEGWEKSVIPGFDPSIESVIIRYPRPERKECRKLFETWGAGAVDALIKLYTTPEWAEFRWDIRHLLANGGEPRAESFLIERFRALARAQDRSDAADREMRRLCAVMGRSGAESFVDALAQEALREPPEYLDEYVGALAQTGSAKALEVLRALKRNGHNVDFYIPRLEGRVRARRLMTEMKEERTK